MKAAMCILSASVNREESASTELLTYWLATAAKREPIARPKRGSRSVTLMKNARKEISVASNSLVGLSCVEFPVANP